MLSIEFIGSSSIGKTHFLKEFSKKYGSDATWDTHLNVMRKISNSRSLLHILVQKFARKITGESFSKKKLKAAIFETYSDDIEPILEMTAEPCEKKFNLAT